MRGLIGYSAKNGFWLLLKGGISFLLSLLTLTLFAHYTSKQTIGIYTYAGTLATIAGIFSLPGMTNALTRSVARGFEGSLARMMRLQLAWGLLGSCALASIATWYWIADDSVLATILFVLSPCVPILNNPAAMASAFWQGRELFAEGTKLAAVRALVQCVLIVLVFILVESRTAIVSLTFLASCTSGGVIFLWTLRQARPSLPDLESERLGKQLTIMRIITVASGNADKLILWHILGPTAVATYIVAYGPISRLNLMIPVNFLLLPLVSRKAPSDALRRRLRQLSLLGVVLMVPAALIAYLMAPIFFRLLFPNYGASIPLFRALLPLVVIGPINAFIRTAFIGTGDTRKLYLTSTIVPIGKLALLILLIPYWGLWGAVAAALAGAVGVAAINFYYLL